MRTYAVRIVIYFAGGIFLFLTFDLKHGLLGEVVLTCTQNLCFEQLNVILKRSIFVYLKHLGTSTYIAWACFLNDSDFHEDVLVCRLPPSVDFEIC